MRLFFAIELDDAVRTALTEAIERARAAAGVPAGLRWLAADGLHVTLQFLGQVDDAGVPALEAAAREAASAHAPFELALGDAGCFGSPRRARIVHVGLSQGALPLTALAASLHAQTAAFGFALEERAFVPHVTVARLREPGDVRGAVAALQVPRVTMRVAQLTLMRSHLAQTGARYEPIARAALAAHRIARP